MRPTIWPTRPNPAMMTRFSSAKCRSYSGYASGPRRAFSQSPALKARGVVAIDRVIDASIVAVPKAWLA